MASTLRPLRYEISGDRDHVVIGQLCHHRLHQWNHGAVAGADLDVVELAVDVHRRTADDGWNVAETLELGAVADRALDGFAAGAGGHDRLALLDATGWHVGDEPDPRIAALGALVVLRQFDDAVADRFGAAIF